MKKTFKTPFEFFITTNYHEKNDVTQSLIEKMRNFLIKKGVESSIVEKLKEKAETQSQNIDRMLG